MSKIKKFKVQVGMTIIEVATIAAILAVVATLAIYYINPKQNKLRDAASVLRTDILMAKSEAIKQNQSVTISSAGHQYNATVGAVVIISRDMRARDLEAKVGSNLLSINNATAIISPTGTAFNANFVISDNEGNSKTIQVNRAAKVSIQ